MILDSVFFSGNALEDILENFVEPELAEALGTISDESGEPTLKQRVSMAEKMRVFHESLLKEFCLRMDWGRIQSQVELL